MTTVLPSDANVDAKRARRREWLLRGTFEAVLILIGLLGAFALDEWQDTRARDARVETLLAAVRTELEANLRLQEDAVAYNRETADAIWRIGSRGETFVPAAVYADRGLFVRPRLTSAAWTAAQNDAALGDMPVATVLLIATIYDQQRDYHETLSVLLTTMYAIGLQAPANDTVRVGDGLGQPLQIGGTLRDFAANGEKLVEAYRSTLERL